LYIGFAHNTRLADYLVYTLYTLDMNKESNSGVQISAFVKEAARQEKEQLEELWRRYVD